MKPKRIIKTLEGFRSDFKTNKIFQIAKFQIHYTSDQLGKTLSIGDLDNEIQFSIPFDELYKEITNAD